MLSLMLADAVEHGGGVHGGKGWRRGDKGMKELVEHVVVNAVMSGLYLQLPLFGFCQGQNMASSRQHATCSHSRSRPEQS